MSGTATSSLLHVGTSVIPNRVEQYVEDDYIILKRGVDVDVSQNPRDVDKRELFRETVKQQVRRSGSFSLSPFSFNWNQHSQIYSIVEVFKELSNTMNLSSCRVDAIADDPGLAQLIKYFGSISMPTAVEGISNRIRSFLQKSITKEELFKGFAYIVETDFQRIKIYMIYTGLENEHDFGEWEEFLKYLQELRRRYERPKLPITVSFTPLFSTLGTPTQYHGSMVAKSMKMGVPPIVNIKKIANRYDISVRMSASIDASDFGQIMDFLDRRGQPLIEYGSLCSFNPFPKMSLIVYNVNDTQEVTKDVYTKTNGNERWEYQEKFYVSKTMRKFTSLKCYEMMMEYSLYPDLDVPAFIKFLMSCHDKPITERMLEWILPSQRPNFTDGGRVLVFKHDPDRLLRTTKDGNMLTSETDSFYVDKISVAYMKELLPMFTNGVTYEDVMANKVVMNVLPSHHLSAGNTRSIFKHWSQYVSNRLFVFESYSLGFESEIYITLDDVDNHVTPLVIDHLADTSLAQKLGDGTFCPACYARETGQPYDELGHMHNVLPTSVDENLQEQGN